MNPSTALIVSGIIFAIVALMHLLRLVYRTEIIIAGKVMPMWASILGFIIPLALAIWMLVLGFS
ncbi:MAG: hypothetical protein ACYCQI_01690 [Gammaproteobacteria bacterium]